MTLKIHHILYLPLLLLVIACSGSEEEEAKKNTTPEALYSEARQMVDSDNLRDAIIAFEEVERQFPASSLAVDAQIMAAYSAYKIDDYDKAISTLERFVKLYPNNESTPYAYYLIALSYYEQIADVARDQKLTAQAQQALRDVVRRFPDSSYARDARIKLDLTEDHLAGKEMQVGRYYQKRGDTLAAINRFRNVIDNYQTTSHAPEALHRLVECYMTIGINEEARKYAAVLGHNFSNSLWYRDSYKMMLAAGETIENSGNSISNSENNSDNKKEKSSWWPF